MSIAYIAAGPFIVPAYTPVTSTARPTMPRTFAALLPAAVVSGSAQARGTVDGGRAAAGVVARGFGDYYFNRLIVSPATIDAGTLSGDEEFTITLWNTFLYGVNLTNVSGTDEGMILNGPLSGYLPTNYVFSYDLTLTTDGPATIENPLVWEFSDADDVGIGVEGSRSTLFIFRPHEATERLEWLTDIYDSVSSEQRARIRKNARQNITYKFTAKATEAAAIYHAFYSTIGGAWSFPLVHERATADDITAGDDLIAVDTTAGGYYVGASVLIRSGDVVEQGIISAVTPGSITLQKAVEFDHVGAEVYPTRTGYAVSGVKQQRQAGDLITFTVEFTAENNIDPAAAAPVTFEGYEVLSTPARVVDGLSESDAYPFEIIDHGLTRKWHKPRAHITRKATVSLLTKGAPARWNLREFITRRAGRFSSFWLPSFRHDVKLITDITELTTSLQVERFNYAGFPADPPGVMILLKNGAQHYGRATAFTDSGETSEITLSAPIGVAIAVADVDRVCFMQRVRLDADAVTISHEPGKISKTTFPVIVARD